MTTAVKMKDIVNLCQNRGFVYPGSEIYGGLANSWDYGPYGSLLKDNIANLWKKEFIQKRTDNMLIDASLIMNPKVWEASGHVGGFADPLMDCRECKARWRADKLVDNKIEAGENEPAGYAGDKTETKRLDEIVVEMGIECPDCKAKNFSDIKKFNLMLKTFLGVTEDGSALAYLRPETAQGQFVDFANVARSSRRKLPFGIAQVGKSFRNEITPGNFIFRTREFEQMEIEYFVEPGKDDEAFKMWKENSKNFFENIIGLSPENLRFSPIKKEELPHYSKEAGDFDYLYPFGWGEIETLANRTDYDLKAHMTASKQNLAYFDAVNNKKFLPYVIEPAMGLGRITLAAICDAYTIDEENNRTYLKFEPRVAPIKIAILPVVKKLGHLAKEIYTQLSEDFVCEYDEVGAIGKRFARMDEIGVPFSISVDSEEYEKGNVTIRFRDSMEQEIVKINELNEFIRIRLK
ncbi:MAG: glycine--tRNA ligase [Candidatus Gracilibacteria bacterium]|nr:glycine--tRNA ligase [Candidatus Gracilibacteria bacterium]MDQ7023768.1 glycine--tRNA ligase [Candidatus Gracilibacteria bacterium]